MRLLLLATYGSHGSCGDIEPMVGGLAARVRALGAEMPARPLVTGATPPSAADLPRRAAALVATRVATVATVAEGCDAPIATGVMPMMPAGVWL